MKQSLRSALRTILPPAVTLLIACSVWHVLVVALEIPAYHVPLPASVGRVIVDQFPELAGATWVSGQAALCGFAISLALGVMIALVFAQSAMIRRSCYPYAIFLQTVPIVAIAPLIINWRGPGFESVVVVVTLISLFPIIANVTAGLISVSAELVDLFRLNRASRLQTLCKLQLPHAIPALVTGARTSSGLAVVGSIVGEFFAGYGAERYGLGYRILQAVPQLKTAELFATVIFSAILGVLIFGGVSLAGSLILSRWFGGNVDPHG